MTPAGSAASQRLLSGFNVNTHEISLRRLLEACHFFGDAQAPAGLQVFFLARSRDFRDGCFPS